MTSGSAGLLEGRVAVVTGGAGALGRAIAHRFAREGASVAVADVLADPAAEVAAELHETYGRRAIGVVADIADPASLEAAADRIEAELGLCDAVVANAGILLLKPALDFSLAEWDRVLRINLTGSFLTATVFAARMRAAGRPGTIVFSSSLFGVRGGRGNAAYSASKFGVIGLSQSLAAELAGDGIRVNAVCPGQIQTAMLDALFESRAEESGRTPSEEHAAFVERIPAGRLGSPDEVADAFAYLSSDLSSYITGQHLVVDGGWQVG